MKEFFRGIGAYPKAHRAIREHRLWKFMIVPGMLSLLYVAGLVFAGLTVFGDAANWIVAHWMPGFMQGDAARAVTSVLLWLLLLLSGYVTYQPVILILFSPFLSFLSEIAESRMTGNPGPPFEWKQLLKDIVRAVRINLRNLLRMVILILLAWLLAIVPLLGSMVSAALIFFIQAFYNGFALTDYTLERKRLSVPESVQFGKDHRGRVVGVGAGFMAMMLVPVIGWFAAPTYGTVAATIAAMDEVGKGNGNGMATAGERSRNSQGDSQN